MLSVFNLPVLGSGEHQEKCGCLLEIKELCFSLREATQDSGPCCVLGALKGCRMMGGIVYQV